MTSSPSQEYNVVHKFVSEPQIINTADPNYALSILHLGTATNLQQGIGSNPVTAQTVNIASPNFVSVATLASPSAVSGLIVNYEAQPWTFIAKNPFSLRDVIFSHVVFNPVASTSPLTYGNPSRVTNIHGTHVLTFYKV